MLFPSSWVMVAASSHEEHALHIFKICLFFENFIHMYSIYIICTPPSMTSISSLDWHFLNLQPFLLQLFCYMCACRKKSRQTDRQTVRYLTYYIHLVSFICKCVYSADSLGLGNLSGCLSLGKTYISCTHLNLYI